MIQDERPLILLGAGGHARVMTALLRAANYPMIGVCDPALMSSSVSHWEGLDVLGGDEALERFTPEQVALVLGVGQLAVAGLRKQLYVLWRKQGYRFPALVHPSAWVAPGVELGEGVQVMAGAIIQPGCVIGENSIINTHASVDHDCRIGSHVHVAPGSTLCGAVTVHADVFIGAGATVIPGLHIGEGAVVGAGVTLVRDLKSATTIVGTSNRCL
jgi:UDP-perosamine 4-acetyltransferase